MYLCLPSLLIAASASAFQPPDITTRLTESLSTSADFQTEWSATTSPLSIDGEVANPGAWEMRHHVRAVYTDVRLWHQVSAAYRAPDTAPSAFHHISAFTGEFSFYTPIDQSRYTISDIVARPDPHNAGLLFDTIVSRYEPRLGPLLGVAWEVDEAASQPVEGIWELTSKDAPTIRLRIEAELEPEFRIRRVQRTIARTDPTPVTNVQDFVILKWQEFDDGIVLPAEATLTASELGRPGYEDKWISTTTTFVRQSATRIAPGDIDATLFEIDYQPGTVITDERLNLTFVVGESSLMLDGISHQLDKPLMEHPGRELAEHLRRSREQQKDRDEKNDGGDGSIHPVAAHEDASVVSPLVLAGCVGVGVLVLLVAGPRILAVVEKTA